MLNTFTPCIPTPCKAVPVSDAWFHEVKYDGYRLIVARDGDRVRLFTRNGHDWSGRYPWIEEAAPKNRNQQFVIDGEAVILGADGVSDFNALHSRHHDDEVQHYAFDTRSHARDRASRHGRAMTSRPNSQPRHPVGWRHSIPPGLTICAPASAAL
jgi:ATP-dependent DNA ligase